MAKQFIKDPSAVLDYRWNWASWLGDAEVIVSIVITAETGIDVDSSSHTDDTVTAWLSGGDPGENYRVGARVTTNQGRTDERSIRVGVEER